MQLDQPSSPLCVQNDHMRSARMAPFLHLAVNPDMVKHPENILQRRRQCSVALCLDKKVKDVAAGKTVDKSFNLATITPEHGLIIKHIKVAPLNGVTESFADVRENSVPGDSFSKWFQVR